MKQKNINNKNSGFTPHYFLAQVLIAFNRLPVYRHRLREFGKHEKNSDGFTLLEMLFVVGILSVFYALILGNYGQVRLSQNLKNGQNELISNISKIRSYSLSGRHMNGFTPKYYVLRIEAPGSGGNTAGYNVQGIAYDGVNNVDVIYNGNPNPNLENIVFPQNVRVTGLELSRNGTALADPTCAQIVFSAPYGKAYVDETCSIDQIFTNSSELSSKANSTLTIHLGLLNTNQQKSVVVHGLSGRIEAQ